MHFALTIPSVNLKSTRQGRCSLDVASFPPWRNSWRIMFKKTPDKIQHNRPWMHRKKRSEIEFACWASFWLTFGLPLAPFLLPLAPFGRPLGSKCLPFGILWLNFIHPGGPFSHFWDLLASFLVPCLYFLRKFYKIARSFRTAYMDSLHERQLAVFQSFTH